MLAATVSWYLPALFLSCLGWGFAFSLHGALHHRRVLHGLYLWMPPVLVAGLLVSRLVDVFTLDTTHPEVAFVFAGKATFGEQLRLLFTGQGAMEGALLALLVFSLFAPRLPSLRGSSPATSAFVQSRMMTHSGWWALMLLVFLFEQEVYTVADTLPSSPTSALQGWSAFAAVAVFTLLLMMSGEVLTASAHIASSGETSVLLQRAILKTLVAGAIAWWLLFQTTMFTEAWWERPTLDARLAVGLLIAIYATWMALVHGFSTVAEGLQAPSSSQAKSLAWCTGLTAAVCLLMTVSMAETVHIYGEGFDAFLVGWGWVAALMFVAAAAMILPTVGFDAAHHPEAWWFRGALMMFVPLGVLASDGAWLLLPGVLMAGATYPLVYAVLINRQPFLRQPLLLVAALVWALGFGASFAQTAPVQTLLLSLASLVVVSMLCTLWLRSDGRGSVA